MIDYFDLCFLHFHIDQERSTRLIVTTVNLPVFIIVHSTYHDRRILASSGHEPYIS